MPQKKHKPEEIVAKLRQVDVLLSQGRSVGEAVRSIGVTQLTYYRWRKEFGGLKRHQVTGEGERTPAQGGVGSDACEAGFERGCLGKLLSPARRRRCIDQVYRNALPAGFSDSIVRHSARSQQGALTKRG